MAGLLLLTTCFTFGAAQSCNEASLDEALDNGASDVVVVRSSTGELSSTGWHGQVGKLSSLTSLRESREGRDVTVFVNSVPARVKMTICSTGTLHFKAPSPTLTSLSNRDLEELNLKPGLNRGRYVCPTLNVFIEFSVFLFSSTDKLVITDIDGTISKSDLKGHLLPRIGLAGLAHHIGVVQLLHMVAERGYTVVYLTARSMAHDRLTRDFLFNDLQKVGQGWSLPPGPLFLSPNTFISSLIAEIGGTQVAQKTQTLEEIWQLFSSDHATITDTVVAAYGNRDTDVKAYVDAGIPLDRIFTVNTAGELRHEGTGKLSSYTQQAVRHIDSLYPKQS